MQIIKKKYKYLSYPGFNIFSLQGIEYPPQTRLIKCYDDAGEDITKQIKFPYIQFILGSHSRIETLVFSSWTAYLSFSDTSLFEGGRRYTVHLPNVDFLTGYICLGETYPKNLKDFIDAFWAKKFTGTIHKKVFINGNRNYTIEIPNIFQVNDCKKYEDYN